VNVYLEPINQTMSGCTPLESLVIDSKPISKRVTNEISVLLQVVLISSWPVYVLVRHGTKPDLCGFSRKYAHVLPLAYHVHVAVSSLLFDSTSSAIKLHLQVSNGMEAVPAGQQGVAVQL
jgi:hypothetical protein